MTSPRQGELFGRDAPAPSDEDFGAPVYHPDTDKVRAKLREILTEARAAKRVPWDREKLLVYRTIFPRMSNWLPEEDGAQLRSEFEVELARLKAA
jgi:hypothetical protein